MSERLVVRGAREHNLKNVSLDLPRDELIVFTGLSGSGKSSLAFDTIYAEGQRRYVESLSSYARQFLGQMDKPDVDFIEGLSPAISIDQKSASRNPRSTVGTVTEIYDYLRVLYARIGVPHCPTCGQAVGRQTPQEIVDHLMKLPEGTRFEVLAPVVRGRKGEYQSLLEDIVHQGFTRVRVDGEMRELGGPREAGEKTLARYESHTIQVVVDRLVAKEGIHRRLTESLETALRLADGVAEIHLVDRPEEDLLTFSQSMACAKCGISFGELEPRSFSFNSPYGACERCAGLGTRFEVDPELVVPDPDLSLSDGAIAPWRRARGEYFSRLTEAVAEASGIDMGTPWRKLTKPQREVLLNGSAKPVQVSYRNRFGRSRNYRTHYEGIVPYLTRRHADAESDHMRQVLEGYMREVPCTACKGARLKPESLAVTVGGVNIEELSGFPISRTDQVIRTLDLSERDGFIAARLLREIEARLGFLVDVGLGYLSLNRASATLAGGEAQRIRLASQIGSGLVGVLYVLDEPSIGLHQRDNRRLIETLERLRDLGNTVVVVEHDEETIRSADHVVDIGPGACEHGGEVIYSGPLPGLLKNKASITGDYLAGRRSIPVPALRRPPGKDRLVVRGASEHNLKGIDVGFPLGCFTCVTGVSGSGKSTLVNDILFTALAQEVYGSRTVPGRHKGLEGAELVDKVVDIDQSPIGRTPRSNPATYVGVFDHVRKLFSQAPESRLRGYKPGRFSFNVPGGRCDACDGDGTLKIEMHFLPDVYVPCEVCKGSRYNRDTLEVTFKGKNIADVLDMPAEEALEFFANQPPIARHMQTLVDVGLGYVRLGQPAPTLSGGEAQRVKLATELSKRATGRTVYILDEPTTGLHFEDVRKLLGVLGRLVDAGNTVVVIEHNLDVVKTADWIVDLGPEGGDGGGTMVVEGPPEIVAACGQSHTGRFLAALVETKASRPAGKRASAPPASKGSSPALNTTSRPRKQPARPATARNGPAKRAAARKQPAKRATARNEG